MKSQVDIEKELESVKKVKKQIENEKLRFPSPSEFTDGWIIGYQRALQFVLEVEPFNQPPDSHKEGKV